LLPLLVWVSSALITLILISAPELVFALAYSVDSPSASTELPELDSICILVADPASEIEAPLLVFSCRSLHDIFASTLAPEDTEASSRSVFKVFSVLRELPLLADILFSFL
jgi:hypothetical protein